MIDDTDETGPTADQPVDVRAQVFRLYPKGKGGRTYELLRDETFQVQREDYLNAVKAQAEGGPVDGAVGAAVSQVLDSDEQFRVAYEKGNALAPPLPLAEMAGLLEESSVIGPCVEAMEVNVEGFDYELEYVGEPDGETRDEVTAERDLIESFLDSVNPRLSLTELRRRLRRDRESMGNAYVEVVTNLKGQPVWLNHVPALTMRLSRLDETPQEVTIRTLTRRGLLVEKQAVLRFRRFLQIVGSRKVWFKELGDLRSLSARTGKFAKTDQEIPLKERATAIYHWAPYNSRGPYGLPRFIGTLPAIRGARYAELVNVTYFQRNAIPPLFIFVNGGEFTPASNQKLQKIVQEGAAGIDNYHAIVVLEAVASDKGPFDTSRGGGVNIQLRPMQSERVSDGQFLLYIEACSAQMRSSFRLPRLFTGREEAFNRATADAAVAVAEAQVFAPERSGGFDDFVNRFLFPLLEVKFHRFWTKGPMISDMTQVTAAVEAFAAAGVMVPNEGRVLANELLGTNIQPFPKPWGDQPMLLTLALLNAGKLEMTDQEADALLQVTEVARDQMERKIGSAGTADFRRAFSDVIALIDRRRRRRLAS